MRRPFQLGEETEKSSEDDPFIFLISIHKQSYVQKNTIARRHFFPQSLQLLKYCFNPRWKSKITLHHYNLFCSVSASSLVLRAPPLPFPLFFLFCYYNCAFHLHTDILVYSSFNSNCRFQLELKLECKLNLMVQDFTNHFTELSVNQIQVRALG